MRIVLEIEGMEAIARATTHPQAPSSELAATASTADAHDAGAAPSLASPESSAPAPFFESTVSDVAPPGHAASAGLDAGAAPTDLAPPTATEE